VPFFASVLRLVYRRSGHRYPAFVYFALHYHAVMFAALALAMLVRFTHGRVLSAGADALAIASAWVYLFMALRRVFGGSRLRTAGRMALTAALYFPGYLIALGAAAAVSIFTVTR
jgi:hypothetical protein